MEGVPWRRSRQGLSKMNNQGRSSMRPWGEGA